MRAMARGILSGLKVVVAAILKAAVIAGLVGIIGAAIAGLAGYLVQAYAAAANLVMVLGQAAGALLLLPGIIFTVISAVAGLKLAFSGLGAAIKAGLSGDLAAMNEALAKMGPNAQDVVRSIVGLKAPFEQLRRTVQEAVLAGMGETIRQLAAVYLPLLERGLGRVGAGLNRLLGGVAGALLNPISQGNIESAFGSAGTVLANLGTALQPLLVALTKVLAVSTGVLARMSDSWIPTMQRWADAIMAIPQEQMVGWIDNAMVALRQLGGLLVDLGGILAGIARAAGESSVFDFFDRIHSWIDSVEGQRILVQVFTALRAAADALSPVLFTLGRVFADLLTGLANTMVVIGPLLNTFVSTLGAGLVSLLPTLNELLLALLPLLTLAVEPLRILIEILLQAATAMGPGLGDFLVALAAGLRPLLAIAPDVGAALGQLLTALAPLLRAIGPVLAVLLEQLAIALTALSIALGPLIELFGRLVGAIALDLLNAFLETGALEMMVELFEDMTEAIRPLIPVIIRLFRDGLSRILEAFERHRPALEQLMPLLIGALMALAEAGLQFLVALTPLVPTLAELVVKFIDGLLPALIQMMPSFLLLIMAVVNLMNALTEKGPSGISLLDAFVMVITFLMQISVNSGFLEFILVTTLIPAINALTLGFTLLKEGIEGSIEFVERVAGLAEKIKTAVTEFPTLLKSAGSDLIQGLINGMAERARGLRDTIVGIGRGIRNWFNETLGIGSPSKVFMQSGVDSMSGYMIGVESQVDQLRRLLTGVGAALPEVLQAAANRQQMQVLAAMSQPQLFSPTIVAKVQIGDEPVREMIKATVDENPGMVADATDEGNRRAAFGNPSRKRVGTT